MDYKEFLYAVLYRLKDEFGEGTEVELYESVKNNGNIRKGVIIKERECNIGPVIYLEEFYNKFIDGLSMDGIIRELVFFYKKIRCPESFRCDDILDMEKTKDKLAVKVINYNKNKEFLKNCPYVRVLDLAVIFYVVLEAKPDGLATVVITNEYMKAWDITCKELYDMAMESTKRVLPARFSTMIDMLISLSVDDDMAKELRIMGSEAEKCMYVLTNKYRNCGAACMLYNGTLDMIGDILGTDFYVLPSSIHEVIIVPYYEGSDSEELDRIIKDVNETLVDDEEFLGSSSYYYDRTSKELKFGYEKLMYNGL